MCGVPTYLSFAHLRFKIAVSILFINEHLNHVNNANFIENQVFYFLLTGGAAPKLKNLIKTGVSTYVNEIDYGYFGIPEFQMYLNKETGQSLSQNIR